MSEYVNLRDAVKRISDDAAAGRVRWSKIIAAGGAAVNGAFIEPDEAQVAIGVLDWIGPRLSDALAKSEPPVMSEERYRHAKRGTVYEVVGRAALQNATGQMLHDHHQLIIYRGDDGKLWARESGEFNDGRFDPLATPATSA